MTYAEMRAIAKNGGVILIEGKTIISRIIRMLTGQNISHVALLFWIENNLMMAEMREFRAFVLSRASDRLQNDMRRAHVYYGEPPDVVAECEDLESVIFAQRNRRYGYHTLLRVLWSQFKKKDSEPRALVCSTFIQKVWAHAGFEFATQADPGDYMRLCKTVTALDLSEHYER